jgi:hypothetical protein
MRLAALLLAGGVWLAVGAAASHAQAFEREWHLGAAVGTASGKRLSLSPALGIYGAYGLSDVFDVRLEVTALGYGLAEKQDPYAISSSAGLVYKLDVLRWVPWAGVYAGYLTFLKEPRPLVKDPLPGSNEPQVEISYNQRDVTLGFGVGLDYAFSRNFGLGVTLRGDNSLGAARLSTYQSLLRAEYRWGW